MSDPSTQDLFKQAGALGVYSYYYQTNRDDFNKVRLRSPIRPTMSETIVISETSRSSTPIRSLQLPSPSPNGGAKPAGRTDNIEKPLRGSLTSLNIPPKVSNIDLLKQCLATITGKDKSAKIVVYLLRLLLCESRRISSLESLRNVRVDSIDFTTTKASLLTQLISNPRILLILLLQQFVLRSQGSVQSIGLYRQILRCFGVPFHIVKVGRLMEKSLDIIRDDKSGGALRLRRVTDLWFNWEVATSLSSFYYAWFDESLLLYKLGILQKNELTKYHALCSRHELIAWLATIIVGLRNDYVKYQELVAEENSCRINYQVKERARKMVRGGRADRSQYVEAYQAEIEEIVKKKKIIQLNLAALTCDLAYDSVLVFNKKMYEPLHISFGLASGVLGFWKVWKQQQQLPSN
ncbi:DEKNAAC103349 [Brettanomyces naardenensis]|uniref:DEKNAAC103349 n=1 Tax=Brettanomyces naardenensis TaxID=13370 RepID=A0A448YN73_BRENA|nr:DEKNAAC103349 [Brettanomyces naardenensis]